MHVPVLYWLHHQTVDAEIKAAMPPQRVREAESRVGNKPSNGPLRAQGNPGGESILRRGAYVSCRGYAGIPQRARIHSVKQGGTAETVGTSKNYPFAIWTDLCTQLCVLKSPQYTKYYELFKA